MDAGEQVQVDSYVSTLESGSWRLEGGRLLLTNKRLMFIPAVPRICPRMLAAPAADIPLGEVNHVRLEKSWLQALLHQGTPLVLHVGWGQPEQHLRYNTRDAREFEARLRSLALAEP